MKLLLLFPSQNNAYGAKIPPAYPPLGLLSIGAILKRENHELEFINYDTDIKDIDEFREKIRTSSYDLVLMSSLTSTISHAFCLAEIIKEMKPNTGIILGGIHPTIAPDECIENKNIDFIVRGEGENTVLELINELQNDNPNFSRINGLTYKDKNDYITNPARDLEENLDKFPFPARELIKNPQKFSPPDAEKLPATPIIFSRGCPGQCTYCCTKQIFGRKIRFRSVENIINEMDEIVNLGYKEIHILDDCFTADKKRIIDLCGEIKKRNYDLKFDISNGLRADMVNFEVLQALKSIGVRSVGFGIESGNELILKNIKKGIPKDKVRDAVKLARKLDFDIWGFFMVGLPGETPKTIKDTINFAKGLDIDYAKFLILKPFPGSEVFNELMSKNLIDCFDYENYGLYAKPVHHLETMSAKEILYWQKRAFCEFYFRPKVLIHHILRINNLTRLKILLKNVIFVFANILKK